MPWGLQHHSPDTTRNMYQNIQNKLRGVVTRLVLMKSCIIGKILGET